MKLMKQIKIKTMGQLIVIPLVLLAVLVLGSSIFYNHDLNIVQAAWNKFNEDRSEKSRALNALYAEIGYGGMIHAFKNFILRGERERFYIAQSRLGGARSAIARYRSLTSSPESMQALDNILAVLTRYEDSLSLAENLVAEGIPPGKIDEAVKVDDRPAFAGLAVLEREIAATEKSTTDKSKAKLISSIRKTMGYGGMIHHYKNFMIRREPEYMDSARTDITLTREAVKQYLELDHTDNEHKSLLAISQTLDNYDQALTKVKQLIAEGTPAAAIDRANSIDDGPALEAFDTLTRELEAQRENEIITVSSILKNISDSIIIITSLSLLLIIFLITTAISLILTRIVTPVIQLTNTMTRLAHDEIEADVYIPPHHDEIREMALATQIFKDNIVERLKAEQYLRAILDTVIDGIISSDTNGIIQTCNPGAASIFNYHPEQLIGENLKILMPEPYHSEHDTYLYNYNMTRNRKIIGKKRELEGKRSDGSTFPIDLAVSETKVGGERFYVGIIRDISERKRVEKMKNEFISTVSHELRTPLTSIRGSLGLISGGKMGELPDKVNEMLRIASNNTERLLLLINDILDMQKIESGMMPFRFSTFAIMPFLKENINNFSAFGDQYNVRFVITHEIEKASIFADRDRLTQVIYNILSNAAKFSPPDSTVEISVARHHDNRIRVSVTDHGPGIPDEFKPKLFDRFTQSDSSDSRKMGGSGLGLAISKSIMQKHGGHIGFVSHIGIGSTFYIELPEMKSNIQQEGLAQPEPLPNQHKPCVLIIEDDPDIAALLQRMMTEKGFNSDIAYDAAHARRLLAQRDNDYKLVTLDILLPGENGISLLTSLRDNPDTVDLPVVIVSVEADEAKRELNGRAISVLDWIQKPIDQDRLTNIVNRIKNANAMPRVLHVEDEADVHGVVKSMLSGMCELIWTSTLNASREILGNEEFDLVLLDIHLPDGSGLDLLEVIERKDSPPRVVIFSAQDVTKEYADKVSSVLVKSNTSNKDLLEVIIKHMKC